MASNSERLSHSSLKQARQKWLQWLQSLNIRPSRFQLQAWQAYAQGFSGLIAAPTGSGKTLAALGGPLIREIAYAQHARPPRGVRILWITPLRALASDTSEHLFCAVQHLLPHWRTAMRTGDASAKDRSAAQKGNAQLLVTTPESLAILLSNETTCESFRSIQAIVVDEWHELLASKRGVLLQLNLARLRKLSPNMQIWGLSATIGNLSEAMDILVRERAPSTSKVIKDQRAKPFDLHTVIPPESVRLPWAGHLGLANIGEVLKLVLASDSSIIFTNTRSQAELWFTALSSIWPLDPDALAIHHGSLEHSVRLQVENRLRAQTMRCVIATSSLDLGVDFPAVDRVIQVGGAHSVSRTVQRAGRSRHRPGAPVQLTAVATQAMDMCEFAATRELAQEQKYEARQTQQLCLDVLAQHAMSMALAGGFDSDELFNEVRTTAAYRLLTASQWKQVIQFLVQGGQALQAYPQYRRLIQDTAGRYVPADLKVARRHRLAIGTIAEQSMVRVQFLRGARIGSVEESFISRLSPGDVFNLAGRSLELFKVENLTAWVRSSRSKGTVTPSWTGGFLPFSSEVGERMQTLIFQAHNSASKHRAPEMEYLRPLLSLQSQRSKVPHPQETLLEIIPVSSQSRRKNADTGAGQAWGLYPFAGRIVHEGLALLLAHRLAQLKPNTFSWSCNHMGLMLLPAVPFDIRSVDWKWLFRTQDVSLDLAAAVNFTELARRRFREVSQIAGLLNARIPGMSFNTRQLQTSSGLLFDVLNKYDPDHILLQQAKREAIERDLHGPDLLALLSRMSEQDLVITTPEKHTPMSFGLWAESLRGQLSNESWAERIKRMAQRMERQV